MKKERNWKLVVDSGHYGQLVKGRYSTERHARIAQWLYQLRHPRRISRVIYAKSRRSL